MSALTIRQERMADTPLAKLFTAPSTRKWGMTRLQRFHARCVEAEGGCKHTGGRDKDGYPVVSLRIGKQQTGRRASHIALALNGVSVPPGQQVNHHCDNRKCVNPEHLFIGTQADNVKDMMTKGRHAQGERHTISLLTDDAVRDIRANGRGRGEPKRFATKYGVSVSTIWAVLNRQNWRHVDA